MNFVIQCVAALAAVALTIGSASASNVTIGNGSGKAFVDNGTGFAIAKKGTVVAAGNRVMAMSGDVVLSDASGCSVTVKPGDMLAVNGKALCASAMLPAAQGTSGARPRNTWIYVAGGVLVAGAIAYWIFEDDDGNVKTSP